MSDAGTLSTEPRAGATGLTEADRARLQRWRAHLEARGVSAPEETDFLTFGRLSTLERLRPALAAAAPEQCGPLAAAIRELRRRKRAGACRAGRGGARGPACRLSVPRDELPADWRETLEDMCTRRARMDRGLILLDGPRPPAPSQIRHIEYALRAVARVCRDLDRPPALSRETVRAWLEREEARGRRETGLAHQVRKLMEFLQYRGEKRKLRRRLRGLAAEHEARGRRRGKLKEAWLRRNPTDIGRVWVIAEELLAASQRAPVASAQRCPASAPMRLPR